MMNIKNIKIFVTRDFLKNKNNTSPKVKYFYSPKQIDEQKGYKPAVELIYRIIKEKEKS